MSEEHPPIVAVNSSPAMSGHFATLWHWNTDHGGFYEPYTTAPGRHLHWEDANVEGEAWAKELGVEFQPATAEGVERAKRRSENMIKLIALSKQYREQGLEPRAAYLKAKQETLVD